MNKLISCVILIAFFLTIFPLGVFALTANEVRQQMDDTNSQIEIIDKEIQVLSSQIAQTSQERNTLATAIKELNLTKSKLLKEKEIIQKKITATGLIINTLSGDIEEKESIISISRKSLSQMIKDLNQSEEVPLLEKLLSANNFSIFSRDYNDVLSLNEKIRQNILEISSQREELLSTKTLKVDEQQNLNTLKQNLVQKEQVVAVTQKEKDSLLSITKNKEAEYQKMLAEQIKKRDTFEKSLADYEAQLQFILNPKIIPKEGSGVLSWPLSYIFVTSPYGARWGTFHYGLDLRAAVGTPVFAMADGVVEGTGNTDTACQGASFGRWIFIKYNNGLSSTYGHLSVTNVKTGDNIKKGDTVGLSGGTKGLFGSGSSTGPHLHVAVYASTGVNVDTVPSKSCGGKIFTQPIAALTAYLNPTLYLPKITSAVIKN